jgi:hypothetical protein
MTATYPAGPRPRGRFALVPEDDPAFRFRRVGEKRLVDDREAGTYSTPPEAAPDPEETRRAREGLPGGFAAIALTVGLVFVIAMLLNALL